MSLLIGQSKGKCGEASYYVEKYRRIDSSDYLKIWNDQTFSDDDEQSNSSLSCCYLSCLSDDTSSLSSSSITSSPSSSLASESIEENSFGQNLDAEHISDLAVKKLNDIIDEESCLWRFLLLDNIVKRARLKRNCEDDSHHVEKHRRIDSSDCFEIRNDETLSDEDEQINSSCL